MLQRSLQIKIYLVLLRKTFFYASKGTNEKQELNSPFYLYFTKKLNNFLQSETYQNHKQNEKTDHK